MLEKVTQLTYRGRLKSCNYTCSYCPFAKNPINIKENKKDEEDFDRFCNKMQETQFEKKLSLLIAPYGEALIYDYYATGLAKLTRLDQLEVVGVQTNLSWNVEKWIAFLENQKTDFSKLTLWCTYHPEMTRLNEFVAKVKYLSTRINLSVGVVGNPSRLEEIQRLRQALPVQIYLWINSMDGLRRKYAEEEIAFFKNIDPLFTLEVSHYGKENSCQCGKEHFFVTADGKLRLCNRMPHVLGHLYEENVKIEQESCSKKRCDCYLSYSHLSDLKELDFFGGQELVRVPKRLELQAIFLDVDGTLVKQGGKIDERTKEALWYLSNKVPLYLVTELPYKQAVKKCQEVKHLLKGGCFANGAHLLAKEAGYEKYYYLKDIPKLLEDDRAKVYKHNEKPYRVLVYGKIREELRDFLENTKTYEVTKNRDRIGIVSKGINKWSGIEALCKELKLQEDKIMVVGNDYNDLEMISKTHYAVATLNAPLILKEKARYILEPYQLGYIL